MKAVEGATLRLLKPRWARKGMVQLRLSTRVAHVVYLRVPPEQFALAKRQQLSQPVRYPVAAKQLCYWHFQDRFYSDADGLSGSQVAALVVTRRTRRVEEANRAEAVLAMPEAAPRPGRPRIPADVKQLVFVRDGGRCVACDSGQELQLDHIIPFSRGGSSTEDNLELLCGPCNRRKGASLA